MEEMMKDMNVEELEDVTGGAGKKKVPAGGSPTPLPPKAGYTVHKIGVKDTLIRIAEHYGTTVQAIMNCNPSIKDKNLIRTGFYIYVPTK